MIVLRKNIDIFKKLKNKGYTQARLKREGLICEAMLQRLRNREMVSIKVLNNLCMILECQPADLIEYTKE